jgi:hypothetical protein
VSRPTVKTWNIVNIEATMLTTWQWYSFLLECLLWGSRFQNRCDTVHHLIDMDMSYARKVRTASYSSDTSHSVSHVLHQHTASHSSYILHLTPYVLHLTPYVLRLTSYTLRLTSYSLRLTSYIISYCILYCVTCIRLVCKTYPWSDASTIRQKL